MARLPGRVQPNGTQRIITTAPGPGRALGTCWRRGLPNWFYREGPAAHGERAVAVTRLEIGADPEELREHIGPGTSTGYPWRSPPARQECTRSRASAGGLNRAPR